MLSRILHAVVSISTLSLQGLTPAFAQSAAEIRTGGELLKSGKLVGNFGPMSHQVRGTASIIRYRDQVYLVLSDDFTFDGAPDPWVGFGNRDSYDSDSTVSPLSSFIGGHYYRMPRKIRPDEYEDFFIWCQQFSIPLARADLR